MQLLISISILLFSFYSTLSIVLYGAVKHWMSGALVSLGDMIGYMMKLWKFIHPALWVSE